MKEVKFFFLLFLFSLKVMFAQIILYQEAKKEVIADEIYLQIILDERQAGVKLSLLEERLKKVIRSYPLSLKSSESKVEKKIIGKGIFLSSTYELKLSSAHQMQKLLKELKENHISNIHLQKVDYSKKEILEKELLIEALKEVKQKAHELLSSINQQLGKVLYIKQDYLTHPQNYYLARSSPSVEDTSTSLEEIQLKPILFKAHIEVHFEIK